MVHGVYQSDGVVHGVRQSPVCRANGVVHGVYQSNGVVHGVRERWQGPTRGGLRTCKRLSLRIQPQLGLVNS